MASAAVCSLTAMPAIHSNPTEMNIKQVEAHIRRPASTATEIRINKLEPKPEQQQQQKTTTATRTRTEVKATDSDEKAETAIPRNPKTNKTKAKRTKSKTTKKTKQKLLTQQPILPHRLPSFVNLYQASVRGKYFVLGETRDEPLYTVSLHSGWIGDASLVLHKGLPRDSEPLATAGLMDTGPGTDVVATSVTPGRSGAAAAIGSNSGSDSASTGTKKSDSGNDSRGESIARVTSDYSSDETTISTTTTITSATSSSTDPKEKQGRKMTFKQESFRSSTSTTTSTTTTTATTTASTARSGSSTNSIAADTVITLPPPQYHPRRKSSAPVSVSEERFARNGGMGRSSFFFSVETGPDGEREDFEWRHSVGEAVSRLGGSWIGWKLVLLGPCSGRKLAAGKGQSGGGSPAYDDGPRDDNTDKSQSRKQKREALADEMLALLESHGLVDKDEQTDNDDSIKDRTAELRATDGNEVVAAWTMGRLRDRVNVLAAGKFKFGLYGSGASGRLGERFALMALMTALRMWDVERRSGHCRRSCRFLARAVRRGGGRDAPRTKGAEERES